jgi:hypothetical protein
VGEGGHFFFALQGYMYVVSSYIATRTVRPSPPTSSLSSSKPPPLYQFSSPLPLLTSRNIARAPSPITTAQGPHVARTLPADVVGFHTHRFLPARQLGSHPPPGFNIPPEIWNTHFHAFRNVTPHSFKNIKALRAWLAVNTAKFTGGGLMCQFPAYHAPTSLPLDG